MGDDRDNIRKLMISVNKIEGLYYLAAKKLGIKENALIFLYALDDGKPHSQKQICDEWFIPRTTINTIVKESIDLGYVTLVNENNSKEKTVAITEKGKLFARSILNNIYLSEQNAMTKTLAAFSPDFVDVMGNFVSHLENEFGQQIIEIIEKNNKE